MKFIFLILFFTVCSTELIYSQGIDTTNYLFYRLALEQIKSANNVDMKSVKRNRFNVSGEVLSFETLSIFFAEAIGESSGKRKNPNTVSHIDPSLTGIGCSRDMKTKVFFTEIMNGLFLVEIVQFQNRALMDYMDRPHFGTSWVFLFATKPNTIVQKDVKQISYN